DTGEIFESKLRGVAEQIESATGMDFDRFTRSMLLAQGGFAAFLQAAPDDRAPILEQITGTEIYSLISIRVFERWRDERKALDLLQAETAGIVILDPEKESEMERLLETCQKEEADLTGVAAEVGKAIAWLTTLASLKKEITDLDDDAIRLQTDIDTFKPERAILGRAVQAASLNGVYAMLTMTRKQQVSDREAWKAGERALPGLESSAREQAEALKLAEQATAHARDQVRAAAPIWQTVRSLDQKVTEQEKAVKDGEVASKKDALKIDADNKTRVNEREKLHRADAMLKRVEGFFRERARDEWLVGGLAGVEEQIKGLIALKSGIMQQDADLIALERALKRAETAQGEWGTRCGMRTQALEKVSGQLQASRDALCRLLGDRMLREYRAEKEALMREMAFLAKIAELEDHRSRLEDGTPCPLCGATEHPFAEGNVPVADETEQTIDGLTRLIGMAEDHETVIKTLEDAERVARQNLMEAEKRESAAASDKKSAEKALTDAKASREKQQGEYDERRRAVSGKLLPLGIGDNADTDFSWVLETLRERLAAWQRHVTEKADIEKQIAGITGEIQRLDAIIETQRMVLAERREHLESWTRELAETRAVRMDVFGERSPDEEERRLNRVVSEADRAERKARDRYYERQQAYHMAKTQIDELAKRIDLREPELERLERAFAAERARVGFSSEEAFREAELPDERRRELMARAETLDERRIDLAARRKDRETRLEVETARKLTESTLEELEPRLMEAQEWVKEVRDKAAGITHALNENAASKERIREKRAVMDAQKKACARWENLHALIGSADGKKYRNFAQGLTFEMMVVHANRQLQKMSDRYLLVRDDIQPLELNVVDNYQAGVIRSTKNLSGGESFIVSLSLALGLSQMASNNVRVDSLFLDEGFGTLDEEALDTALETLAGLQQDGKLIGVISHVSALKERIGSQILVIPITGGRSRITGPGVRRIDQ
ncbi:chromosome segregation protein SMC, partial [bacterium]|nr:chromosome segregation protein SMC [candidate division CSSED10-310 bacterium]